MKIPVRLAVCLVGGIIWFLGFQWNPFLADRQFFHEYPVIEQAQGLKKLFGQDLPKGVYNVHTATRQPKGSGTRFVMAAFTGKALDVKNFLLAARATAVKGDAGFDVTMRIWGCRTLLGCPIPWWNTRSSKRRYFYVPQPLTLLVTVDQSNATDSTLRLFQWRPGMARIRLQPL